MQTRRCYDLLEALEDPLSWCENMIRVEVTFCRQELVPQWLEVGLPIALVHRDRPNGVELGSYLNTLFVEQTIGSDECLDMLCGWRNGIAE